jgi:hypothetical protein
MNSLKNKYWVGIHRAPEGEEEHKTRKELFWRRQGNEA